MVHVKHVLGIFKTLCEQVDDIHWGTEIIEIKLSGSSFTPTVKVS